ncbi:MAG: sodium:calcium antiporter [Chitinispirillaceae bacterium]|nr:sodium:calcium antiporter [Chitinispirillaceae bacterium]
MVFDGIMLIVCLGLILLSCIMFVNAIECFGKALNLHQGIIGSILAAVGTALPETIIPIIAILFTKGEGAHAIGIGAIVGAPFMLGTLAFFVTGSAVIVNKLLGRRTTTMNVDRGCLSRDLLFFLIFYGIAVSVTFFHGIAPVKWIVAIGLALSYALYLKITIHADVAEVENVETLYCHRFFGLPVTIPWIVLQVIASLAMIIGSAHLFIHYVEVISRTIGVSPLILSLIITPIATELPEKLNSVIWVSRKRDTLALGNITGAMVFQSCFPVAIGIMFTAWDLRGVTMVSAACALFMAALALVWVRIRGSINPYLLLFGGVLYALFMAVIIF